MSRLRSALGEGRQRIHEHPFLQAPAGVVRHRRELDSRTARIVGPHDVTARVDVRLGLGQVEHEIHGAIRHKWGAGLNRHSTLAEIENFGEVENHRSLYAAKTGVCGRVNLVADAPATNAESRHILKDREWGSLDRHSEFCTSYSAMLETQVLVFIQNIREGRYFSHPFSS